MSRQCLSACLSVPSLLFFLFLFSHSLSPVLWLCVCLCVWVRQCRHVCLFVSSVSPCPFSMSKCSVCVCISYPLMSYLSFSVCFFISLNSDFLLPSSPDPLYFFLSLSLFLCITTLSCSHLFSLSSCVECKPRWQPCINSLQERSLEWSVESVLHQILASHRKKVILRFAHRLTDLVANALEPRVL